MSPWGSRPPRRNPAGAHRKTHGHGRRQAPRPGSPCQSRRDASPVACPAPPPVRSARQEQPGGPAQERAVRVQLHHERAPAGPGPRLGLAPVAGPADSGGLPAPPTAHQPRAATWAMAMTFWLIPRTDGSLPSRRSTARIRFRCSGSPRLLVPCGRSGLPQGRDAVVPARQVGTAVRHPCCTRRPPGPARAPGQMPPQQGPHAQEFDLPPTGRQPVLLQAGSGHRESSAPVVSPRSPRLWRPRPGRWAVRCAAGRGRRVRRWPA